MTAAAALPPQTGLKRLAAALAVLCAALLLLATDNRFAVEALRALEGGVATVAGRVTGLAEDLPSRAAVGVSDLTEALPFAAPLAAAPEDTVLAGEFASTDGSAPASVAFVAAEVRFDGGETFRTEPLRIAAGSDRYQSGQTFARRLKARPDAQIELRRVIPPASGSPASSSGLCAGAAPGFVAVLHRGGQVDLMLFRAGATPGPNAPPNALCGVWTFQRR